VRAASELLAAAQPAIPLNGIEGSSELRAASLQVSGITKSYFPKPTAKPSRSSGNDGADINKGRRRC
jgi:hypothetical protein